MTDFTAVSIN